MGQTVEQSGRRAGRSLDDVRTRGAAMGAALGTALGSAALLFGEFGRAAAEEEVVFARLRQSVEATGKSYIDYSDSIDRAIERGKDLAFSDDQIADALGRMTTTTGDAQASLDNLGLAMDFARARGIDLSTAADLIAKAYTGNFAVLARYGIQLDENATSTEALAAIQAKTAGQAEAYGNTQAASMDRAKNAIDDATESLGAHAGQLTTVVALLPGITAGWTLASGAVGGVTGALTGGAGATGALVAFGSALGTVATAALIAAPAIAAIGYTAYTAKDHIEAVTEETKLLNDALTSGGVFADEFSRQLYGLFSQNLSLAEVYDPITRSTQTLESTFDELVNLRGEYQAAFIDMARSAEIDFANPTAEDIQFLIDQLLYFYRLQNDVAQTQLEMNRAAGRRDIVTTVPATDINVGKLELMEYGRQRLANQSVEDRQAINDYAESAGSLESSFHAAISATNAWSREQNELDQQLRESLGLMYDFATGSRDAGAALDAFKGVQDGLLGDQQVYNQQQSEYQSQMSALEAGYQVLQERQAAGIPLTQEEQALLDNYPQLYGRLEGGADDAAVAQALLAAQYAENVQKGDELNRTLQGQSESTDGLTRAIQDMVLMMDGVPDEVRTQILLDRADESIADLIAYYNWLNSIPRNITTVVETIFVQGSDGGGRSRGALHGGVVGYADGGVVARMGEAGPEPMYFSNGGSAWAMNDGLYNVPRGTYVTPAPAGKAALNRWGDSGGIHLHNPIVNVYPATGDVQREFTAALVGDWR